MPRSQFTRKLILYRNGDPSFKPINFLYNNTRIRTFEKLLEELDARVPPLRGGAVKNLYTVDGDYRIETREQLEGDNTDLTIVVGGPEPYRVVKGGYPAIGQKKPKKNLQEPPNPRFGAKLTPTPQRPANERIHNRYSFLFCTHSYFYHNSHLQT